MAILEVAQTHQALLKLWMTEPNKIFNSLVCRVKSEPIIEIEYENKSVERIVTSNMSITQILELVQNKAQEMDTAAKLKAAGIDGQKLISPWLQTNGKEQGVGQSAHIPRQQ